MTIFDGEGQPEWDNNDYSEDFFWLGIRRDLMNKYTVSDKIVKQLENNFTYHPPKDDQQTRYILLRDTARELAFLAATNTPISREQSLGFTKLEEAIFWFNAAIARNE
jgi:hypothetical protein